LNAVLEAPERQAAPKREPQEPWLPSFFEAARRQATAALKPLWVGIDLRALEHNAARISDRLGATRLCAVLKGDAYGHGIENVAVSLLKHCSHFAVVDNYEALLLRRRVKDSVVLRLRPSAPNEIAEAIELGLRLRETAGSLDQAQEVGRIARHYGKAVDLHVSLDASGLGRGGFPVHDPVALAKELQQVIDLPGINVASVGCHLRDAADCAPARTEDSTRQAVDCFTVLVRQLCELITRSGRRLPEVSVFSSAGSIAFAQSKSIKALGLTSFDRIGNSLFGLRSSAEHFERNTRQVMHVGTRVCMVVERPAGATVGYEHAYQVPEDGEELALLGVGWSSMGREYQGIGKASRPAWVANLSGGAHPLVGRQSMNVSVVRAVDDHGRRLKHGDFVWITTDAAPAGDTFQKTPSVAALSACMQNCQHEYITTVVGSSSSARRFVF
jgi:alanine racemase